MLCVTSDSIEGKAIVSNLGLVAVEVVIGANMFRELLAAVAETSGRRSSTYERVLEEARSSALADLEAKAIALKADAILSLRFQYLDLVDRGGTMMMCAAYGTAVRLARSEADRRMDKERDAEESPLYFVVVAAKERGPLSLTQLRELHTAGKIEPETIVRVDGETSSVMLSHLLSRKN